MTCPMGLRQDGQCQDCPSAAQTISAACMLQGKCVAWWQQKEKGSHIPSQLLSCPSYLGECHLTTR